VLVIKEDGGSIVKTPEYTCDQNYQSRIATVSLLENGEAKAKVQTKYGGARFMDEFPNFIREKEDVKKALYREIDIHDFTINDYNVSQENDQTLSEELNLNIHSFAKKSQQNLIVPLNLMNKVSKVPPRNEARNSDVFMRRSFREEDLVTYQLPPGYAIGSQPDEIAIDSKFGTYKVSVSNQGRIMEYKRILTVNKGTFPATDYESLVDFISQIAKADRMKVLLVKK